MLISKTTLTSEPVPHKDYELTLKFKMTMFDGELPENLSKHLQNHLNDWYEGRHPFYVEMLKEGLWKCLTQATSDCIVEECQEEFGSEAVQVNENQQTAKWYLESQKRKPDLPHLDEEISANISQQLH